jgi:hypothetical protein
MRTVRRQHLDPLDGWAERSRGWTTAGAAPARAAEAATGRPFHPAAAAVLSLQRGAGNRAVAGLFGGVQRPGLAVQRHEGADDPEMQAVLGKFPIAGPEPDVDTVPEADASVQRQVVSPVVGGGRVDQGPADQVVQREVGIAKKKTVKAYSKRTAKALSGLTSGQAMALGPFLVGQEAALNDALDSHKVPPPAVLAKQLGASDALALFRPKDWEITVNTDRVPGQVDTERGVYLAGVLFHEARHAEQWFSMIRHVIFMLRREDKLPDQNTYTVNEHIPAPVPIIVSAFRTTKKKDFNKGEKAGWAKYLYDRSVTPAKGAARSRMSPEVLAGETVATKRLPAFRAADEQSVILQKVNASDWLSPFPLDTTGWSATLATAAAGEWATAAQAVRPVALSKGHVRPADPWTDADAAGTFELGANDATVQAARHTYLTRYTAWHSVALKVAEDAYLKAYHDYRALPVEQDAYATQDLVDRRLKKDLKL